MRSYENNIRRLETTDLLSDIRELCSEVLGDKPRKNTLGNTDKENAIKIAEAFRELDLQLIKWGQLPDDWKV
jgi:hypothetical protein